MAVVKVARRRGTSRVSAKNQITIPVDALRRAGVKPGDVLKVEAAEPGRIVLARVDDPIWKYAGIFTGVYPPGYLKKLRREWRY